MSTRAEQYVAEVTGREVLSPHLVRLVLGGPGLTGFTGTGVPDEWVGLVVPGQFQSRYYTVRSWDGRSLLLDVALRDYRPELKRFASVTLAVNDAGSVTVKAAEQAAAVPA